MYICTGHTYGIYIIIMSLPVRHWLEVHTVFLGFFVFISDVLGIHSLYSNGSTRPRFTKTFCSAANTLKHDLQGDVLPHSSHLVPCLF